jgi:hypothetical protein
VHFPGPKKKAGSCSIIPLKPARYRKADALGQRGIASLEQFERMFEQRIGRALVRIGIASRDYIDRLMSEVT